MAPQKTDVSDSELKAVIADFLNMGHVDNIVAMFRHESLYYQWVGELLCDERFGVRLGLSVLFEELAECDPNNLFLAIPSLARVLRDQPPLYRGEALSLLATIGTAEATQLIHSGINDEDPRVKEMAMLLLEEEK